MHNTTPDTGWENCGLVCVETNNICVQTQENCRLGSRITSGLSIGPDDYADYYVGRTRVETLMLSSLAHILPTAIFRHVTDMLGQLSPLSTGPITTTTKNIY